MGTCSGQKQIKDPKRRKLTKEEQNDLISSLQQFEDAKTVLRLYNYSVCQITPVLQPYLKKNSSKEPNVMTQNKIISKLKHLLDMHELASNFGKQVTQIDVFIALTVMETYIVMKNPTTNMDLQEYKDYFRERIEFLYYQFKFQDLNRQHDKSLEGMIDTLIKCETALFPWVANIFNINYTSERTTIANAVGSDFINVVKDLSNNF